MLLKIHSRGAGCGNGPVDYLLGKNRDRDLATVLRGNPDQTIELIDSLDFKRKYTSGVLSFEETDITDEKKQQIMDSLEHNLLAGLEANQYEILWVEHRDKDRLELNFVIPNVELKTGKRLQPYYDKADRKRCISWQEIQNYEHGLSDPNHPEKRRTFNYGRNLPSDKKEAIEHINNGLINLISSGEISDRNDILNSLKDNGFTITRTTKKSISITLPGEARATRLNGAFYEQNFRAGTGIRDEIEENIRRYCEEREQRVRKARETYHDTHKSKSEYHRDRYQPKRIEISKAINREYQQLRKGIKNGTAKDWNRSDLGAGDRHIDPDFSAVIAAPIQNNQLVGRVKKYDRHTEAVSINNQEIGTEFRTTTGAISAAIGQLTESIKRYAESATRALRIRRIELAERREEYQPSGLKLR